MQNPFIKRIHPDFDLWGVFFINPQKGRYIWTGSGVKPEGGIPINGNGRPFRIKEFTSEKKATEALGAVKEHIRNYKDSFEIYIQEK